MPGILMSSTYVAVPVIRRGSSRRRMRLPTSFSVFVIVGVAMGLCSNRLGRGSHGVDDVLISGAAAQVAFQPVPDFLFTGIRIAFQDLLGGHDHAGRAKTALQAMLVPESFLHLVELAVGGQALDGEDLRAVGLDGENRAALHGFPVQFDGARAA